MLLLWCIVVLLPIWWLNGERILYNSIANNAVSFSGIVISLNNNEHSNIYLSASTSTLHITLLELGNFFVLGTNICL